jgi:dipeptidyl aminopeptidase/acylaminoacyl peptidase
MPQRIITSTPADYWLPFEDTFISVKDQSNAIERLHAWYIPSADDSNNKVLLYLHGSALNIGANIDHARRFRNMGFSVLLLSYRGYGISDGDFPSEKLVYADAEAAWDYLVSNKGVDPHSIFIYGHSLGGAVAIQLATTQPNAGGLIVEGTFTSIAEMARLFPQYRFLPLNLIINQRFDSAKKVNRLEVPVLYIHGTGDERVPFEMSHKLYKLTSSAKRIKLILGGGHNNTAAIGGEEYLQSVRDFIWFARSQRPSLSQEITEPNSNKQISQFDR